jgi:protein-tyrosine phosphatase
MAMIRQTITFAALSLALAPVCASAKAPADAAIEKTSEGQLQVSWSSPDPVDVLVSASPRAPAKAAKLVSASDADGKTMLPASGTGRDYIILRDTRTGEFTRVAERLIPLEAGSNFRDIGGYAAAGGKHVRWGLIYRSGGTPLITQTDQTRIRALGLANMVDLRSGEERVLAPTRIEGVPYTAVGYSMGKMNIGGGMEATYRAMPAMFAPQLKQIFARLLRNEGPLAYNCSAGQDRTGFTTAVVLSALGTPRETIIADYHLSTKFRRPEFEMPHIDIAAHPGDPAAALFASYQDNPEAKKPRPLMTADGKAFLSFALAEIDARWGSVDGYLAKELGVGPKEIARLRANYTE